MLPQTLSLDEKRDINKQIKSFGHSAFDLGPRSESGQFSSERAFVLSPAYSRIKYLSPTVGKGSKDEGCISF